MTQASGSTGDRPGRAGATAHVPEPSSLSEQAAARDRSPQFGDQRRAGCRPGGGV